MQAKLVTGLFQYEPCDLTVKNGSLCFKTKDSERVIAAGDCLGASLSRMKSGLCNLILTTKNEQYDLLLDTVAADEATGLLYTLTKNNERLELRMCGE